MLLQTRGRGCTGTQTGVNLSSDTDGQYGTGKWEAERRVREGLQNPTDKASGVSLCLLLINYKPGPSFTIFLKRKELLTLRK